MASAGRLRFGRSSLRAPVLNDIAYDFGKWTYIACGGVSLSSSRLGFVDAASGPITTFTIEAFESGNSAHWNGAVDAAAGNTVSPVGHKAITGSYVIRYRADGPGGSDTGKITVNIRTDAANFGDTIPYNYPEGVVGTTAALAYNDATNPLRYLLISTGIVDGKNIGLAGSFTFPGEVIIKDADATRRSAICSLITGSGSTNITYKDLAVSGYYSGSSANLQFTGVVGAKIDGCTVIDSEATYNIGAGNYSGILIDGTATTATIVNVPMIRHKYRGITVAACASCFIDDVWIDHYHAQGIAIGNYATNVDVGYKADNTSVGVLITNLWRTVSPTLDIGTHQEPIMILDAGVGGNPANQVAQNVRWDKIIALTGNANSAGRGAAMVGGGLNGAAAKINNLKLGRMFMSVWGLDCVEIYGVSGDCRLKSIIATRVLSGDDSGAVAHNNIIEWPWKDYQSLGAIFRIAPGTVDNVDGTTNIVMDQVYIDASLTINAIATPLTTIGSDVFTYARATMAAGNGTRVNGGGSDSVGFLNASPRAAMEAYTDWDDENLTRSQIQSRVFGIWGRADNKGPFNSAGTGFNATLPF